MRLFETTKWGYRFPHTSYWGLDVAEKVVERGIKTKPAEGDEIYRRERRDYRCWLGGQLLFFVGDFPCCIKPQMRERMDGKASEWACRGMTQGAKATLLIPTFLRQTGEYTYSLLLKRSSGAWLNLVDGLFYSKGVFYTATGNPTSIVLSES